MKKIIRICLLLSLHTAVFAAPSGGDLLIACKDSITNGFHGKNGMMCVWYVTPCDCHYGINEDIPRVCLPEKEPPELLAREIIDGLNTNPELLKESAEMAAGLILSPKYPCD